MNKIGPVIVILFFLVIGILCVTLPHKIQTLAIRYYDKPAWVNRVPVYKTVVKKSEFVKQYSYIIFLRVMGIASLIVGIAGIYLLICKK